MTGPLGMGTSQSPPTPMKGHCRKNRARLRTLDQLLLQDLSSQRCGSRRCGSRRISPSCGASASSGQTTTHARCGSVKQLGPAHDNGNHSMIWIKNKSCRCVLILNVRVSVGVAFSESQHDHPENSHDCCRAPGEWNFTSGGAERSADGRPNACGRRR